MPYGRSSSEPAPDVVDRNLTLAKAVGRIVALLTFSLG